MLITRFVNEPKRSMDSTRNNSIREAAIRAFSY
jgi:hypothetical protein